jgi:hypothetical protein
MVGPNLNGNLFAAHHHNPLLHHSEFSVRISLPHRDI